MAISVMLWHMWLDALLQNDRTHKEQHHVKSKELLEPLWVDRMRPVLPDRTLLASGRVSLHALLNEQAYISVRHADWTHATARLVRTKPTSVQHGHSARAWPEYRTRPMSIPDVSGHVRNTTAEIDTGRIRSTCQTRPVTPWPARLTPFQHQLLLLCKCTNTTKCTPPCACVLPFSQSFFKGLATQLATPLDPSNDAKLDHSSGTRWPICKQVCPSW
jgi:hypothetical protein